MPLHVRQRFCSQECAEANRQWGLWRSQQVYRQTKNGKAKRAEQSVRYRQRTNERRQRKTHVPPELSELPVIPDLPDAAETPKLSSVLPEANPTGELVKLATVVRAYAASDEALSCRCCQPSTPHPERPAEKRPAEPRVGHKPGPDAKKSCCLRPGCYVRFTATSRSPLQCFCSSDCRMALRRVRLREARWFRQQPPMTRELCPPAEAPD